MGHSRVRADDEHHVGKLDVLEGASVPPVADRAHEGLGGRALAIARTVIHVVGAKHGASELLN